MNIKLPKTGSDAKLDDDLKLKKLHESLKLPINRKYTEETERTIKPL